MTYCLCGGEVFSEHVVGLLSSGVTTMERDVAGGVALGVEMVGQVGGEVVVMS